MQQKSFSFQKYYWLEVLMIIHSWIILFVVPELQNLPLFDKNRDIKAQGIIPMNPMALFTELCFTASVLAKDDTISSCGKL